jgi:hypothetical protein
MTLNENVATVLEVFSSTRSLLGEGRQSVDVLCGMTDNPASAWTKIPRYRLQLKRD